jgi:hypothetical protein
LAIGGCIGVALFYFQLKAQARLDAKHGGQSIRAFLVAKRTMFKPCYSRGQAALVYASSDRLPDLAVRTAHGMRGSHLTIFVQLLVRMALLSSVPLDGVRNLVGFPVSMPLIWSDFNAGSCRLA